MEQYGLTDAERCAYAEEGFFIRCSAFSAGELDELRTAAERADAKARCAAGNQDAAARTYRIDGNRYLDALSVTIQFEHDPATETLRVLERLVEPIRGLVGCEDVALFTSKLNFKRPHEGSRFRWHQDSPYWAHVCRHLDQLPNVMLALDDATEANGCLRVVRGSHKEGMLPGLEGEGRLGPLFTDPRCFDASGQVPAAMPAGSLLFFSPHTVHGSEPNRSAAPRRALIYTYQPAGHRLFKIDATRNAVAH
jgi:ectoine hydroxylase-related dioxygenase (phytanoyl-CoA dioxygenase family)